MTAFFCLAFVSSFAQVKVYKGNSSYTSDVICNLKGDKVYKGNSSYQSDILCRIDDNKVYKGNSSYSSDILFTIRDGKVYRGLPRILPTLSSLSRMANSTKAIQAIHQTSLPTRKATKCIKTTPIIRRMSISPFPTT